jgi:formamidase
MGSIRPRLQFDAQDVAAVNLNLCHPLTGPVYIEGAKRGDAIAVTVVDIAPDDLVPPRSCQDLDSYEMCFPDPYIVHWELEPP